MTKVQALVLTGFGINCAEEMRAAYMLAGANADIVPIQEIFSGELALDEYDILNFPGGFSFGDDLGAGRVLANTLKYKKMPSGRVFIDEITDFLEKGKYILGICNGFQVLTALGLLPGLNKNFEQEVSLVSNTSGKFEDRWVKCSITSHVSPLIEELESIELPVRHGEGRLVVKDLRVAQQIIDQNLIVMKYCDKMGNATDAYPENPNGSFQAAAALTNPSGQVLGMMPHPEAYLSLYNHPNWGMHLRNHLVDSEEGGGLQLFKSIVKAVKQNETIHAMT
jgi:phosphoribosylformylglycinamidine synthase I